MGGLLVGSVLGSIPGVAWADDPCPQGQTRCGERCVNNLRTNESHCGSCFNRCGSNHTCCKGRCVNLQRNERHCGCCFHRCAEGQKCVSGVCQGPCQPVSGFCTNNNQCCSGNCDISGFCLPPTGTNRVDCFCSNGTQDSRCTSLSCSSSDADAIRSFVCNPLCAINGASTDSVGCVADAACA